MNAVKVAIPVDWSTLDLAWRRTSTGLPLCRSNGETLCLKPSGWELVERCTGYAVKDPNLLEPMNASGAITILSGEWIDVGSLEFFKVLLIRHLLLKVVEFKINLFLHLPEQAHLWHLFQKDHIRMMLRWRRFSPGTTPVSRTSGVSTPQDVQQEAEQQQREPSIEIGVQASDLPRPALPDAGSQHVALQVVRDSIDVNGVHLTASSPVATLRGACKYLSLPSSGGKQKLFNRIIDYYDQQQLSLAQEVQASLGGGALAPVPQPLVEKPSDEEVREHQLTHIPRSSCRTSYRTCFF